MPRVLADDDGLHLPTPTLRFWRCQKSDTIRQQYRVRPKKLNWVGLGDILPHLKDPRYNELLVRFDKLRLGFDLVAQSCQDVLDGGLMQFVCSFPLFE